MRKVIFIYSLIHVLSFNSFGQSVFNNDYHYNDAARVNAVIQTSDSAFLMVGTVKSIDTMSVIKVNFNGDTLWTFTYDLGIGGGDIAKSVIETSDGNYIIGGMTADISVMNSDAFLIKLKPNGDTVWVRKIGLANRSERCYSVKQTPDGGFVFCGLRYNVDSLDNITESDVYLVKTDSAGYPLWEKTFGGVNFDWGLSIELTSEGGYMIFGNTYSYGVGLYNMYLIKTDSIGNMIWQKTYGGNLKDYATSIIKTNDGDYVLAGGTYISTDTVAAYVSKIDTAGAVVWEKRYKGGFKAAEFNAVKELSTGELVVSGDQQADALNYLYYGITKKLDSNGDAIWEKQYKYFSTDSTQHYFFAMDLTMDGGFVMAGMTIDYHHGANPTNGMWLVKTDCMGNDSIWDSLDCSLTVSVTDQNLIQNDYSIKVYPNPFSETTTVEYVIPENMQNSTLYLNDVVGNEIKKYLITGNSTGKLTIDGSTLNSGVYSCHLVSDKKIVSVCKLIIIK